MLLLLLERNVPIDDIVWFDWGMEFPEMYEHVDRLERYIGRPITRLYAEQPFEYWMFEHLKVRGPSAGKRGYGWPHWKRRWCTRIKLDALKRYCTGSTTYIGITVNEAWRRSRRWTQFITPMWGDESPDHTMRFPLVEWNVDDREIMPYCRARGFDWGGLYDKRNMRHVSCWCCSLQGRKSLVALHDLHPELWTRLLDMDERNPFPWPGDSLGKAQAFVLQRDSDLAAIQEGR